MQTVSVLLVGIGGYGGVIAQKVFENRDAYGIAVVGVVEPNADGSPVRETVMQLQIPVFDTMADFYAAHTADLAILCSPIYLHEEQAIFAMEHGSHCLCEKPTAATAAQSLRMEQAAQRTGRQLHIGYQLCYLPAIRLLKTDILSGRFGKPLCASAMVCWPRDLSYFARPWCGKRVFAGKPVNDSIAMNACAHYLQLMLYLLDADAAMPTHAEAILCRGNDIETFDTAMLRLFVRGARLDYFVTHTCEQNINPKIRFRFENAVIEFAESWETDAVKAIFPDGSVKHYGAVKPMLYEKLLHCIDAVRGLKDAVCTPTTALPHLICIEAITEHCPVITHMTTRCVNGTVVIPGIDTLFTQAYAAEKMPWELTDIFGEPAQIALA